MATDPAQSPLFNGLIKFVSDICFLKLKRFFFKFVTEVVFFRGVVLAKFIFFKPFLNKILTTTHFELGNKICTEIFSLDKIKQVKMHVYLK